MLEKEMDIGPIRPPSEGGSNSLLIRTTRNCPWNRCTFCYGLSYNHEKFQLRSVEEIKEDIDIVRGIADKISEVSAGGGPDGNLDRNVLQSIIEENPEVASSPTFATVFNWLASGGKTVFLQDADSLVMKTSELKEVLNYLMASFSSIERVTSYARLKTALKKSVEELTELREAGLTRLHAGLETGDDYLLKKVKKGITAEEHIRAGKKIISSGIELSTYIMPGLGGLDSSMDHAVNTAAVLNEIDPDYIRSRPFIPRPGTPIFEEYERGDLRLLSPHSVLREIGMLVNALTVMSRVCFDHAMNPSYRTQLAIVSLFELSYEGYQLPESKDTILEIIDKGLSIEESAFIRSEDLINAAL